MPRVAKSLSAAQVRELSKFPGEYVVGGASGLVLVVRSQKNGATRCYWFLRRQGKHAIRLSLGSYPECSLKDAREKAYELLRAHRLGELSKDRKETAEDPVTNFQLEPLVEEWLNYQVSRGAWKKAEEAGRNYISAFRRYVFPDFGKLDVRTITPQDVAEILRPIWCDHPKLADRIRGHLAMCFVWLMVVKKLREPGMMNPAATDVVQPLLPLPRMRKKGSHYPYLPPERIPEFMAALRKLDGVAARCTEFAILTCTRSSNIRQMKWVDIDLVKKTWTIDAEEMKAEANGQHIVPLSTRAMEILKGLEWMRPLLGNSKYVFASEFKKGRILSENTLNSVIRQLHDADVRRGGQGWTDPEVSKQRGVPAVAVQHAIARSSFESWAHSSELHEEVFSDRVIQLCLHHAVGDRYRGAYDRDKSMQAKRALLQAWCKYCMSAR